ncbi:hypothetical protein BOTBODRAFT_181924 [Botryobasidium botryosum FD-172 SS1]|uniref:Uncharacterized protein n=1 Tax=Botryobasidium botryosum (strain FD-172 SS1) TaxID=930990 RepID=A0A067M2H3_BOTB1|nr:hypothetical protein BOTBODRAFT_181924 [Botryobasidium botryosum FD-172 SS1]
MNAPTTNQPAMDQEEWEAFSSEDAGEDLSPISAMHTEDPWSAANTWGATAPWTTLGDAHGHTITDEAHADITVFHARYAALVGFGLSRGTPTSLALALCVAFTWLWWRSAAAQFRMSWWLIDENVRVWLLQAASDLLTTAGRAPVPPYVPNLARQDSPWDDSVSHTWDYTTHVWEFRARAASAALAGWMLAQGLPFYAVVFGAWAIPPKRYPNRWAYQAEHVAFFGEDDLDLAWLFSVSGSRGHTGIPPPNPVPPPLSWDMWEGDAPRLRNPFHLLSEVVFVDELIQTLRHLPHRQSFHAALAASSPVAQQPCARCPTSWFPHAPGIHCIAPPLEDEQVYWWCARLVPGGPINPIWESVQKRGRCRFLGTVEQTTLSINDSPYFHHL